MERETTFTVNCLAITGVGVKIFKYGERVKESQLEERNIESLISEGAIVLESDFGPKGDTGNMDQPLPEDFPELSALEDAGFATVRQVFEHADITAVKHIGPKGAKKIAEYLVDNYSPADERG